MHEFIEKAVGVHGHNCDYSEVDYVNSYTPVKIICKKHGYFFQKPSEHLRSKYSCPECRKYSVRNLLKRSYNEFLEKSIKLYGSDYEYKEEWYGDKRSKVYCKVHGVVSINNRTFLEGMGCPKCGYDRSHSSRVLSTSEFVDRAVKVHGHKYDYTNVDYSHNKINVGIRCQKHGVFYQEPNNHLEGKGCPKCSFIVTKFHDDVQKFIKSIGIGFKSNDRKSIDPYEIDILCDGNIGIECHGLFWHSYDKPETKEERFRHYDKYDLATKNGVSLIQIYENEWKYKNEIIKSVLSCKFGKNGTIGARKCTVVELSFNDYHKFMDANHIQGSTNNCSVRYGLIYGGKIVSCIGFNRHFRYGWEISRFASLLWFNVIGGFSKLFRRFITDYNPNTVLTYSDRRYFSGDIYRSNGFIYDGVTAPGFCYTDKFTVYPRQKFQKHKLPGILINFNKSLTGPENMFVNGYRRIWDAGNHRLLWRA